MISSFRNFSIIITTIIAMIIGKEPLVIIVISIYGSLYLQHN